MTLFDFGLVSQSKIYAKKYKKSEKIYENKKISKNFNKKKIKNNKKIKKKCYFFCQFTCFRPLRLQKGSKFDCTFISTKK